MVKYKEINQYHSEYDADYACKLELLFNGGKDLLKHSNKFIAKLPQENAIVYQQRLSFASYHNYFGKIINDYLSNLFSKQLSVLPASDANDKTTIGTLPKGSFYKEFSKNADLGGNTFSQVLSHAFEDALVYGKAFIGIDTPAIFDDDTVAESLAEEEALGADRSYLYDIDYETVINWSKDDEDKFKWVILKKEQPIIEPLKENDSKKVQFKYWFKENDVVKFMMYEIIVKLGRDPKPNDEMSLVREQVVSFKEIPIKELKLPDGLWIGNHIYSTQLEHFKTRSNLLFAESRAMFEVPFYQQSGNAASAMNPVADDENRGKNFRAQLENKGFLVGTDDDKFSFIGPSGEVFGLVNSQLRELSDDMHSIHHMMAQTIISMSSSKSGASKIQDNRAKEIVLSAYGEIIKNFAKKIYECISIDRKEDIVWQVIGMQDYKIIDRDILMLEIQQFNLIKNNIPSKTFLKAYTNRLASYLEPEISPETQIQIKEEIDESIENMGMEKLYKLGGIDGKQMDMQGSNGVNSSSNNIKSSTNKPPLVK